MISKRGLLVVISGPAGSGKGTIIKKLMSGSDAYDYSVSATTRGPRPGEEHGRHYYFISRKEFAKRVDDAEMLEYVEYCGNLYGTPRKEIEQKLAAGLNVILEIEVVGALKVKELCPDALMILVLPPSYSVLEKRLRDRKTNDEEDIGRRMQKAKTEVMQFEKYDYIVPNYENESSAAAQIIDRIVNSERYRTARNPNVIKKFLSE